MIEELVRIWAIYEGSDMIQGWFNFVKVTFLLPVASQRWALSLDWITRDAQTSSHQTPICTCPPPLNDSPIDETFSCWWVLLFITLPRCWQILLLLFYVPHKMTETYNIKDLPAFVNQFWMKVFSKSCTNLSKLKRMRQLSLIRMKCFLVRDKFHQICDVLLRLIIERGDRGGQAELILWSFGDIAWDLWSPPTPRLLTWTISTTRCVPTGRVSLSYQKNQNM